MLDRDRGDLPLSVLRAASERLRAEERHGRLYLRYADGPGEYVEQLSQAHDIYSVTSVSTAGPGHYSRNLTRAAALALLDDWQDAMLEHDTMLGEDEIAVFADDFPLLQALTAEDVAAVCDDCREAMEYAAMEAMEWKQHKAEEAQLL